MRRGLSLLLLVPLLLAGCGSNDAGSSNALAPEFPGTDREQIAATVETMLAAVTDGDGELACSLMASPEEIENAGGGQARGGQEAFTVVIRRVATLRPGRFGGLDADASCEDAVAVYADYAERIGNEELERQGMAGAVKIDDISFSPGGGQTVEGADYAQVNGPYRGAIQLEHLGGRWVVTVPFYLD